MSEVHITQSWSISDDEGTTIRLEGDPADVLVRIWQDDDVIVRIWQDDDVIVCDPPLARTLSNFLLDAANQAENGGLG